MWDIKSEIINASKSLNIDIDELTANEAKLILSRVINKYTTGKVNIQIWESFIDGIGINDKDAWRWISEIIGDEGTVMFFNPEDEKVAFMFKCGADIVSVLSETIGFEFYLTNELSDYVICFNHHDVLIACGTAKERIEPYR